MTAGALTAILALVGHLGSWAALGGPLGLAMAWVGSFLGNKMVKLVAIGIGLAMMIAVTIGITVRIEHLERDSAAYKILFSEVAAMEKQYGCDKRPANEQKLSVCLVAIDRDKEAAKAAEIQRLSEINAQVQNQLDAANAKITDQEHTNDQAIDEGSEKDDGPVPKILLDTLRRLRTQRGLK